MYKKEDCSVLAPIPSHGSCLSDALVTRWLEAANLNVKDYKTPGERVAKLHSLLRPGDKEYDIINAAYVSVFPSSTGKLIEATGDAFKPRLNPKEAAGGELESPAIAQALMRYEMLPKYAAAYVVQETGDQKTLLVQLKVAMATKRPHIGIVMNTAKRGYHWVVLYIDLPEEEVEFWDPLGRVISKQPMYVQTNVKAVRKYIKVPEHTFKSSSKAHQLENIECGVYAIWFLTQRERRSMADINKTLIHDAEMCAKRPDYFLSGAASLVPDVVVPAAAFKTLNDLTSYYNQLGKCSIVNKTIPEKLRQPGSCLPKNLIERWFEALNLPSGLKLPPVEDMLRAILGKKAEDDLLVIDDADSDVLVKLKRESQQYFKPLKGAGELLSDTDISEALGRFATYSGGEYRHLEVAPGKEMAQLAKSSARFVSFVLNSDAKGAGEHWLAFYADKKLKTAEFFDSFGLPPAVHEPHVAKFANELKAGGYNLTYNTKEIQKGKKECGMFAIWYISSRVMGFTPQQIAAAPITDAVCSQNRQWFFRLPQPPPPLPPPATSSTNYLDVDMDAYLAKYS